MGAIAEAYPIVEKGTMLASSHGLPTSLTRETSGFPHLGAPNFDLVDPGSVRGVAVELLPAGNRAACKLVLAADHVELTALLAFPNGQAPGPSGSLEIIQSPMLRSQSSSRSRPHSGIQRACLADSMISSRQLMPTNHSSTRRYTSSSLHRQQCG